MNTFKKYANYYDYLYQDKNYHEETDYIDGLIRKYHLDTKSIIDFGCGTGTYDMLLGEKGYDVIGIDVSREMLKIADHRLKRSKLSNILYEYGDIRIFRSEKKYDTVLSLFHVLSYQTTDKDLMSAFKTIKFHLKKNGLFIFDFWFGPAVLTCKPEVKVKRFENDKLKLIRIAEPIIHVTENIVDVNYTLFIQDKTTGRIETLTETHNMRYLFETELKEMLKRSNLKFIHSEEFGTGKQPGLDTWGVCFIGTHL